MKIIYSHQARWFFVALAIFNILGCTRFQTLQVSRHTNAAITNQRADTIFSNATTVLRTNDGAGDVSCCVEFERSGTVTTFALGNGIINSGADFNAVIGLPGNVKVVNQINWCGGFIIGIIGCAPVPGTSLAVVRFTANQEGILWAHEYGHNKGRNHRTGTNLLMNPTIGTTRTRVNAAECSAILSGGTTRFFRFCGGQTN